MYRNKCVGQMNFGQKKFGKIKPASDDDDEIEIAENYPEIDSDTDWKLAIRTDQFVAIFFCCLHAEK